MCFILFLKEEGDYLTDLEKLKKTFDELEIGYTENTDWVNHKYLFIHYTGVEFYFDEDGKYLYVEQQV